MAVFPQLGLPLAPETAAQKALQFIDGRKDLVSTSEHPAADLRERELCDHIHGDSFAVRQRQLRGCSATLQARIAPKTYQIVSLVLDQVQIKLYDFSHYAAKSLDVGRFPLTEMRDFFICQILLFVFGWIVDAVPQVVAKEWGKLLAPHFAATVCEFDGSAEISQHGV